MGFYFRKSLKFGPFRLNLSKSGVGVTAGVRGARISTGPRGTYIHAGKGGFYYRQRLDSPSKVGSTSKRFTTQSNIPNWVGEAAEIQSSQLITAINPTPRRSPIPTLIHLGYLSLMLIAVVCIIAYGSTQLPKTDEASRLVLLLLFTIPWPIWVTGILIKQWVANSRQSIEIHPLYYDLDQSSANRFSLIKSACASLSRTEKLWYVTENPYGLNLLPVRSDSWIVVQQPPGIATNVEVWCITLSTWKLFFLPDGLYVLADNSYRTLPYDSLRLSYSESRMMENSPVPRDAEIVDHYWRFSRKDGGPDLRYKNNWQIPVAFYGTVNIESADGLKLQLQTSARSAARSFVERFHSAVPETKSGRAHYTYGGQEQRRQERTREVSKSTGKSPYEVLGLKDGASREEIITAFRQQASMNHPDKVANMAPEFRELAERRMKEINAAYNELIKRFRQV